MAPLSQVAGCLVALAGIQSLNGVHGSTLEAVQDLDFSGLYLALNLARRGHIDPKLMPPMLDADATLAESAKTFLTTFQTADCGDLRPFTDETDKTDKSAKGLVMKYTKNTTPDFKKLVQDALQAGVTALQAESAGAAEKGVLGTGVFAKEKPVSINLAYMLNTKSSKVGCFAASGCQESSTELSLILCRFDPDLAANTSPFTKEYFEAVASRKVTISQMKDTDVNSGLLALPSVLMGLVAVASAFIF